MPVGANNHLARPLLARERSHRRIALVGIAALILLSATPVFGHHVADQASALLAGRDHLFNVCLVALHELLAPVHTGFHVLLAAGVMYAVWDRARAVMRVRGTLGALAYAAPLVDDATVRAAVVAGVDPGVIRTVAGLPTPAFTAGWWRPVIYIAGDLSAILSTDQLATVLAHEEAHRRGRDPLRLSALRFLGCALFYLPALRRLADDIADDAEIAADDAAAAGTAAAPMVLASAILALASRPNPRPGFAAVGFQRRDLLERRVRRLAGEDAEVGTHVTRRSLAAAAGLLVAVWVSGLIMAHPLPAEAASRADGHTVHAEALGPGHLSHCTHRGEWAITHLFCRGLHGRHESGGPPAASPPPAAGRAVDCPHAGA